MATISASGLAVELMDRKATAGSRCDQKLDMDRRALIGEFKLLSPAMTERTRQSYVPTISSRATSYFSSISGPTGAETVRRSRVRSRLRRTRNDRSRLKDPSSWMRPPRAAERLLATAGGHRRSGRGSSAADDRVGPQQRGPIRRTARSRRTARIKPRSSPDRSMGHPSGARTHSRNRRRSAATGSGRRPGLFRSTSCEMS